MTSATPSDPQLDRQAFFAQLGPYLKGLYSYAAHLLNHHESLGDLPRGHLKVEDVVDAAVVEAYRALGQPRAVRDLRKALVQSARRYVQQEIRQVKQRERMVSKEEDVPETPPEEEVMTQGEEIFEFFEPDEDLKMEDVIPDLDVPTPEEVVETAQLRQCVDSALAGLPTEWRQALILRYAQGLKGASLSKALGKPVSETSRVLERARAYLRQKLMESGCAFTPQEDRTAGAASSP